MLKRNEIKHNKIEEKKIIGVHVGNIFNRIKINEEKNKIKNEINMLENNKREKK